jgi:hypothetical protein
MKVVRYVSPAALLAVAVVCASPAQAQHYTQVNLVANTSGIAPVTDPNLVNPWGISRQSGSPWWISDNGTGLSTLYNGAGAINPLVVTIPKADPNSKTFPTGTPTGTIANGSATDFLLAKGAQALFLFSTIDGTIQGWNPTIGIPAGGSPPSKTATIVYKAKDGSSYTGLPRPPLTASVTSTQPTSPKAESMSSTQPSTKSHSPDKMMTGTTAIATMTAVKTTIVTEMTIAPSLMNTCPATSFPSTCRPSATTSS